MYTLELTTDEIEVLKGLIDELNDARLFWGPDHDELNSIHNKIETIHPTE